MPLRALPLFPMQHSEQEPRASALLSPSRTPLRRLQLYPVLTPDIPVGSCACCDSNLTAFYYCSEIMQSSKIIPGSHGVIRNTAVSLTPCACRDDAAGEPIFGEVRVEAPYGHGQSAACSQG